MIGNFLTRGLVMIFGYAYPAYECYKTVEKNKPEIEQLRFWCQYWILVALMTVFERVSDAFISWLPMYSEAKLAFIIYLWYPRTKGTTYVYDSFFKPYVSKHEMEIDRNLLELRIRAGDMTYLYCQKAVSYGQTRIFEILQYIASQSTPRPHATQPQQPAPRTRPTPAAAATATVAAAAAAINAARSQGTTQPQDEEPLSPSSSSSSSQDNEMEEEISSSKEPSTSSPAPALAPAPSAAPALAPAPAPSPTSSPLKKSVSHPPAPQTVTQSSNNNADAKQTESLPTKVVKSPVKPTGAKSLPLEEETAMDEAIRVTRGRLRKTRSTSTTGTK